MAISLKADPKNQPTQVDLFTSFSDITSQPRFVNALSQAHDIGRQYPGSGLSGKYSKQGLSSDVRHTLGTSAGKDAMIDWLSQFGIDTGGKMANVIGNIGITGATALEEIPDAWRSVKQAFKEKDYGAITSGNVFAQPWEDIQANLNAWDIPYGTNVSDKMDYIPGIKKWMMDKRATEQGIAQVAMQKRIREAEEKRIQEEEKKRIEQEKIKTAQDNWKPTYNPASSHAEARSTGGDYHSGHQSTVGGQTTDWGSESAMIARGGLAQHAPRYANGGLIDFYRYGGFI
jgi:hypothetical protein